MSVVDSSYALAVLGCGSPVELQALSIPALLELCLKSNDSAGWGEFVRRFHPTIAGTVVKNIHSHRQLALVDDLVQECFLKLCNHDYRILRGFRSDDERNFYGLLRATTISVV